MSIVVIGVNHRTGPLSVLERLTIAPDEVAKAVAGLAGRDNLREVAVLSTCHRIEVYAVAERFHPAYAEIRDFLCHLGALAPDELHPYLYSQHEDAAARHLFEVAAGLHSAVIGESEILGQVRGAWQVAKDEGAVRSTLDLLFRHAMRTGKRARTETAIGRGTASISHAAVEMVTDRLGDLAGRRVLVVGAGEMGVGVATALHRAGVADIVVANRTPERGLRLAEDVGGRAVGLDELVPTLAVTDVVLACTASGESVVTTADLQAAGAGERPMLVVDIAVPRSVELSARTLARRHRPRSRRPARLGRSGPGPAGGRDATASAPSSPRSSSTSCSRRRPARRPRWSPSCTSGRRRSAPPSSAGSPPASPR